MLRIVQTILYLVVLIPAVTHLIRYRDIPSSRRMSAGLGAAGVLLIPTAASLICEILVSVFSVGLFLLIFVGGIGMMLKALFR